MDVLGAMKDLFLTARKEKKDKNSNEFRFYQEIVSLLGEYYNKVEDAKYKDEFLIDQGYDLVIEGLELMHENGKNLTNSPYLESVNPEYRSRILKIIAQSSTDLRYYQNDFDEDNDDPTRDIIESIILIYREANEKIMKNN
ncbi:hypothetical protein [Caldalkalibacillus mannanilyticus]|uniref:hypothetical protein n=1 Tax=Caldalkalibacillus mannanilyticus TaxID=1418 RepID=UPI00046AF8CB|nr:hypothetical protein [Caldalkalibacillus mannanilyticus]